MIQDPQAFVTDHFYDWEQRGRGWLESSDVIQLEPPFHPFFFHPNPHVFIRDEGKRSFLGWIGSRLLDKIKPVPGQQLGGSMPPIRPYLFESREPIKVFSISLPRGYKVGIHETEQLLLMLSYATHPISFEIIGNHKAIMLQVACRQSDERHISSQMKAFFPESSISQKMDLVEDIMGPPLGYVSITDVCLKEEFMRPIAMSKDFSLDPFIALFGAFEAVSEDEMALVQILFSGTVNPWSESIMRSVTASDGKSFFEDAPEMVSLAQTKVSSPLFGVAIRILGKSLQEEDAIRLSDSIFKSFVRIYNSPGNSFIAVPSDLPFELKLDDIVNRTSHRLGMLLNARELAGLVHFPSNSVSSSRLVRDMQKTKAAPASAFGHTLVIGINEHHGTEKLVSLDPEVRLKHTHIIGSTGSGKSTLLLNMIIGDIAQGSGMAVLDPHGDLIEAIYPHIHLERLKDVLVIDPADADYPIGFNVLSAHSEIEKHILSSDLVAVFRRLSTSWGDQMNSVFGNAILAFLESPQGGTLADVRRFLVEKSFRDNYIKTVQDPHIAYYWQKEFPLLRSNSIGSILTRLDSFLRPKLIRNMVAQKQGIDFENLLDSRKIILVKLSQGLIGAENSYLLGTFFVSKVYQAAMARQAKEDRPDFFMYIDEFQNFITPSMSSILSGARKYRVGLVLAHQDMQQLVKNDSELASSVVANAGTRICFRLGDTDAKRFESGFSHFTREDLENLHTGEAIMRIERPENDFNVRTLLTDRPEPGQAEKTKNEVIEHSRKAHGTPRAEVEEILAVAADVFPVPSSPVRKAEQLPRKDLEPKEFTRPQQEMSAPTTKEVLVKQKEQTEHRYLQMLIKRMAESRGYVAKIEEPIPGTQERVDVSLEKNGERIAVEVCVSTEAAWEVHNIQKCMQSGYDLLVSCSNNQSTLEGIEQEAQKTLDQIAMTKVRFFQPEQLFLYLDQEAIKEASTEIRVKGYRVKVDYAAVSGAEMNVKKEQVSKAILNSLRPERND